MATGTRRPRVNLPARNLAVSGSLITGVVGITMAIYSVVVGEEAGGAALLAASALAFGLLALTLDRSLLSGGRAPTTSSTSSNGAGPLQGDEAPGFIDSSAAVPPADAERLTDREHQVLRLVAEGFSNKLISADLGISERTVKNHLTATMAKLRASDRTHAVVTAARLGWLRL
jgi:DNA-binding NarL/FixJ family response regulator